ncbi:hypothetical protein YC2023_074067 [Brassica napus]
MRSRLVAEIKKTTKTRKTRQVDLCFTASCYERCKRSDQYKKPQLLLLLLPTGNVCAHVWSLQVNRTLKTNKTLA